MRESSKSSRLQLRLVALGIVAALGTVGCGPDLTVGNQTYQCQGEILRSWGGSVGPEPCSVVVCADDGYEAATVAGRVCSYSVNSPCALLDADRCTIGAGASGSTMGLVQDLMQSRPVYNLEGEIDDDNSSVSVSWDESTPTETEPVEGTEISFHDSGGPGVEGRLVITSLTILGGELTVDGHSVEAPESMNGQFFTGYKWSDDTFALDANTVLFSNSATVDDDYVSLYAGTLSGVTGDIDYTNNVLTLDGELQAYDEEWETIPLTIDFHLEFTFTSPYLFVYVFDYDAQEETITITDSDSDGNGTDVDHLIWYEGDVLRDIGYVDDNLEIATGTVLDFSEVEDDRVTLLGVNTTSEVIQARVVCLEDTQNLQDCLDSDEPEQEQ